MRRAIPVLLWLIMLATFGILSYVRYHQLNPQNPVVTTADDPPGRLLTDTPWRHFQDVPPFQMTNQLGQPFDSRNLAGKPFFVNFFFARCPVICREFNSKIAELNEQLRNQELAFVSITVDPVNDTPEVLNRYAQDFGAAPDRWFFLTDQPYKIVQLGEQVFEVPIGNNPADHTHTEDLLLVDKWGRFRDRFRWSDPDDVRRLMRVIAEVCDEAAPPLEKQFRTRNVVAGQPPLDINRRPWIREFHLLDQDEKIFYSRDLTGQVWIANFFYTQCQGSCLGQSKFLRDLRARLGTAMPMIVSITTDPVHDGPPVLREYARKWSTDDRWRFCTGDKLLIQRIGSEFFNALVTDDRHSSRLFVLDRWHQVRGSFDWQNEEQVQTMLELIELLKQEDRPVHEPSRIQRPEWKLDPDEEGTLQ